MRFRFILFILLSTQIFSQTSIIIKYKSEQTLKENISAIQKFYSENQTSIINSTKTDKIKIISMKDQFGKLNSELNKIVKVKIEQNSISDKLIAELQNNPNVEYISFSHNYKIDYIPEDSLYAEQWGLKNINAPEAYDLIPVNTEEILLAVIDTGIDYLHPDIKNKIFFNNGEIGTDQNGNDKKSNGIDDDGNGFIDDFQGWDFVNKLNIFPIEIEDDFNHWDNEPMDDNGHGTNIAGIIAAEHNNFGIAGVDPNVKILNLRAFDKNGTGEEDDAASAIIYAVKMGAKVINMSWGDSQFSQFLKDVIQYAYENEVTLVASSGNDGSNLPHYPSSFPEVISVGAIQENEVLASYSNYGSTMDLVAPGSQILTTSLNNTYKKVSGTSAAAPFVSGSTSIIKSIKNFSNEEVKQIIKSTARDLGNNGWDDTYGAGTLNLEKALQVLSPSEIKINFPSQDYSTNSDLLKINVSCLSPYFQSFTLSYGLGYNPISWNEIKTGKENFQIYDEDLAELNISQFSDTVYTLRLVVQKIDGSTLEERTNFIIDHTPPVVNNFNVFPVLLNETETIQISVSTNEPTCATLFFRERNSNNDFKKIFLDGLTGDQKIISKNHFGIIPIEEVLSGVNHEFYFEVTNNCGLSTEIRNNNNLFEVENFLNKSLITNNNKYSLPAGRIFNKNVKISGSDNSYIFINEDETSSDMSIYKFTNSSFEKVKTISNRIPVSVGDFNNDGKTDLLSLFVNKGYIETIDNQLNFTNKFSDTTGAFWPSLADDIDRDGNTEVIVFSTDTTITIWEISESFTLAKEATLENFADDVENTKSFFRNNTTLIADFDGDLQKEILTVDNFGRIILFQINGNSDYSQDKIVEHFFPLESNTEFACGDFNGDGIIDIATLIEFENDVFGAPVTYCNVFNLTSNGINQLFQNMFIAHEHYYTSKFQKNYRSIKLTNIDNTYNDELIIFNYPNSYIFSYGEKPNLLYYQSDVNTQSIFADDLDKNGIPEIAIPNGNILNFHEFINDGKIQAPIINDYYCIDSTHVYFEWNNLNLPVFISRKIENQNWETISSTKNNYFVDSLKSKVNSQYYLEFFDSTSAEIISLKSNIITVYVHAPGKLINENIRNNNLELFFSQPINSKDVRVNNFIIDSKENPSSVIPSSENSLLLTLSKELLEGNHNLEIKNLRDFYNTPFQDTSITFSYDKNDSLENKFYITNFSIIDNKNIMVKFNLNIDTLTSLNINNYSLLPNNKVEYINFHNNSKNEVIIKSANPFGAIGREYILSINNIFSSKETGYIPISENSGSEIVLTSKSENLDDLYVFPNPVKLNENKTLTIANLPNNIEIYVFSIDGKYIQKIIENDGNGGVDWDLKDLDNKIISSGIYIFKAISLDNFGNKIQEKICKFAVLR